MRISEQNKKLVDYLKKNLKKGYTVESLKWALVSQGYSRTLIDGAIIQANKELAEEAPLLREKPIINYEVTDLDNNPIEIKKPFWKRIFGIFFRE